ncbi:anthranilate phosphoribosyltransferase [Cenarchaeum symbiosum A]|uniref:Anthranilate phosphoribosyltransferase n=1 Tax=Cenarchaeum symbiosum (strain A) TaxID=414004 RepID=TRPD_CENSY|nr:RecName: Full=Anthranilate phosphoribosyltransferase [Cenarchaeum symbiosum A]ABK77901.1 anthranilate phosphoribosyltransferase [Cenarchaeum symbiosum A]
MAAEKLRRGEDLTLEEAHDAASGMLGGMGTDESAELLSLLARKGETDEELLGVLEAVSEHSERVVPRNSGTVIDVCGTGGDGMSTLNVSTACAFVAAASGCTVAKHGNRSSSGCSGSADIFERLGCDLDQRPGDAASLLEDLNICFMYAPRYHPALAGIADARKKVGGRTVFNLVGPLCNPAGVRDQLVGVSSQDLLGRIPRILHRRGAGSAMAVMSDDGMDELSTSSHGSACILRGGEVYTERVDPEALGLHASSANELRIHSAGGAFHSFVAVLDGRAGRAMAETVELNAAAALVVGGISEGLADGIEAARVAIEGGAASDLLDRFVAKAGDPGMLREARE